MLLSRLVFAICLWNCICLLLLSSLIDPTEANLNCLRNIKSQVDDPNGYLSSWEFNNDTEKGFICMFRGVGCWDDENRVMSIELSGYGLRGVFPLGIKECSDLTGLDLSRNNFSGPLPSNLTSVIPFVTVLDLSFNKFSGEIPASISNVSFLNSLNLQNNQFTGQLPPQLVSLRRLAKFNVANNCLVGPIPNFNETLKFGPERFNNNMDLCGKPLDDCKSPSFLDKDFIIAAISRYTVSALVVGIVMFFRFKKTDVVRKKPSSR